MRNYKLKIKSFIFVIMTLTWMSLIFYFSSQPGSISSVQSDGVKDLILKGFSSSSEVFNYINNSGFIMFVIRKSAHMFLYFVLSILVYLLSKSMTNEFTISVKISMFVSIIYAATDEIHQLYVVGRSGQLKDVWIDSIGVFVGIIFISIIYIYKTKKVSKNIENTSEVV